MASRASRGTPVNTTGRRRRWHSPRRWCLSSAAGLTASPVAKEGGLTEPDGAATGDVISYGPS